MQRQVWAPVPTYAETSILTRVDPLEPGANFQFPCKKISTVQRVSLTPVQMGLANMIIGLGKTFAH